MDLNTFLDKIVFGWIKHDLERMKTSIPALSGEAGNINFPLALCVLAYLEYLGGFLIGEDKGFAENSDAYIKQCFERPDEYPIEILRDIFRNGLAHEYFARGAISRDGETPAIFNKPGIGVILDVETLVDDFLQSLEKFKENLSDSSYQSRMNSALQKIEEWKATYKKLIDSLPTRAATTTTTTTSSGASVHPGPVRNTTTVDPTINGDNEQND